MTTASDLALQPRRAALADLIPLATDALPSENSRRAYRRALSDFLAWTYCGERHFTRANVMAYRAELEKSRGASAVNQPLSAIRKLAAEAADNGLMDAGVAASILRVPGLPEPVGATSRMRRQPARVSSRISVRAMV